MARKPRPRTPKVGVYAEPIERLRPTGRVPVMRWRVVVVSPHGTRYNCDGATQDEARAKCAELGALALQTFSLRNIGMARTVEQVLPRMVTPRTFSPIVVTAIFGCGHTAEERDHRGRCERCGDIFGELRAQIVQTEMCLFSPPGNDCDVRDISLWVEGVSMAGLQAACPINASEDWTFLSSEVLGPFDDGSAVLGLCDAILTELDCALHHVVQVQTGERDTAADVDVVEAARELTVRTMRVQRLAAAMAELAAESEGRS